MSIARGEKPKVGTKRSGAPEGKIRYGLLRGRVKVAWDFDAPPPEQWARTME